MFKVCCRRDPKKEDEKSRLDARDVDWILDFASVIILRAQRLKQRRLKSGLIEVSGIMEWRAMRSGVEYWDNSKEMSQMTGVHRFLLL